MVRVCVCVWRVYVCIQDEHPQRQGRWRVARACEHARRLSLPLYLLSPPSLVLSMRVYVRCAYVFM